MVPPFAVEGVGAGGLAVPMGMVEPIFVDGFVLTLNGSVKAASMEREKSPAVNPPIIHKLIRVMLIERIFIFYYLTCG